MTTFPPPSPATTNIKQDVSGGGSIPDPEFGAGGIVSRLADPLPAGATNKYGDWCQSLAIQSDGRIVAGVGHATAGPGNGMGGASLRRFNSNGSDDPGFGAGTGRISFASNGYNFVYVQVLPGGWILAHRTDGYGDYDNEDLIDSTGLQIPIPWTTLPSDVAWQALGSESPGQILLVGQSGEKLIIAGLLPDGSLDRAFGGAGSGYVSVDPRPSPAVVAAGTCCDPNYQVFLSQDGQRLYFSYIYYAQGGQVSGELGRVHVAGILAGQRDESFGVRGSIPFALPFVNVLREQSPDNLLIGGAGGVFRLSAGSGRSPGIIGFRSAYLSTRYGTAATILVARVAGDDGAVSTSFRTDDKPGETPTIYETTSGQLNWADGENGDKSVSVHVLPQAATVSSGFNVLLENPVGGVLTLNGQIHIQVAADPPPVVTPQPIVPPSTPVDSPGFPGGGGSTDALSLLLLLMGAGTVIRRRLRFN